MSGSKIYRKFGQERVLRESDQEGTDELTPCS